MRKITYTLHMVNTTDHSSEYDCLIHILGNNPGENKSYNYKGIYTIVCLYSIDSNNNRSETKELSLNINTKKFLDASVSSTTATLG